MVHKKYQHLSGILSILIGIFCVMSAIIALISFEIDAIIGSGTIANAIKLLIDGLKGNKLLSFLILFVGFSYIISGKYALFGRKVVLDMNVNYKVISIETDDAKGLVKIKLEDTLTSDTVEVQKETKYLNYFKNYIETNGDIMPGTIAKMV